MALLQRTQTLAPRKKAELEQERQELTRSIRHTQTLIKQAYGCFNHTSDTDLIESYVFEINALQARYNYLLRRFKQLEKLP